MATQINLSLPTKVKSSSFLVALLCVATFGSVLILISTPWGPGLREDSFSYITAAESFNEGTGLGRWAADGTFRPLTHFPPLLPLLLAGSRHLGLEYIPAARLLNAFLLGASSLLVGLSLFILTESRNLALVGSAMSSLSNVLLEIFSWAHSEPLYIALSLISLISLAYYMRYPAKPGYLLTAIAAAALTFLTRFAGIALIGASTLTMLLFPWSELKRRVKVSSLFLLLSSAPTAIFIMRNRILYGTTVDRPLPQWHPPPASTWAQGADTILGWFAPHRIFSSMSNTAVIVAGTLITLCLFIAFAFASYQMYRRFLSANLPIQPLWFLSLTNLLAYCGLLMVTVLFLDRLTPLNDRILSPIYPLLLLMLPTLGNFWLDGRHQLIKILLSVILVVFLGVFLFRGIQTIRTQRELGLGLSTPQWHASKAMEYLRKLPSVPIYTNDIPAIYFHTGHMAHFIPVKQNPAEGTIRQDYPAELLKMRLTLLNGNGILVLFGSDPESRLHTAELSDLIVGLEEVKAFKDAIVFQSTAIE
jgi:hypothetical protein